MGLMAACCFCGEFGGTFSNGVILNAHLFLPVKICHNFVRIKNT